MLNNAVTLNTLRFVLLVLAQVLIFNSLNLYGYINPLIYVLFFYWYPIKSNRPIFLLAGFLMGFVIDMFADTMALHAMAALTVAYARPLIMRFCFGINFEFQGFSFKNTTKLQRFTFLACLILIQHVIFFTLEILSFSHILLILKKILFTGMATLLIGGLLSSLFNRKPV
ncbi:MAG: rod shape-determining protein MreD [Bacteroidota bacterium]